MANCQDQVDIKIHKDLLLACGRGKDIDVHLLLQQGASLRVQDQDGRSCLHYAAGKGHKNIVKILVESKVTLEAKDKFGSSPLHQACANGHEDVAAYLIESGAKVDVQDEDGNTPLHTVAAYGCHRLIKILCEKEAPVNAPNKAGNTPLHIAAQHNYVRCVLGLLKYGANLESRTTTGDTVLHIGIYHEYIDLVSELLSFGADINVQNYEGNTPVHLCSEVGNDKLTKLILEQGCPFESSPNMVGDTAKDIAIQKGHKDIVDLLPSPKITRESSRRSRKRDGEKSERTKEEKSPSVTPTRRSSRRRSKKSHRESKHQGRAVRHASLDEIQHSDSFSSLTSLWIPVTSSGLELPMDWYWDKKHPMSSAKKTMKQVDIEIRKEDNVSPKVTHYKYARELTENGRPVRHNPRVRPRTAVVKGKKKKSKGQKQNVETTIQVDSPGEIMDGSDDRSDFLDAEQLILEQDLTEAANTSELKTTQRGQAKKRERKKNKENQKDISTAKGEKSGKSKSKEKEKDNKNMPPSLANLQLNQLSPRVQGRLDMRKAGLELTANGIKRGEGGLKHWPEFQVNDSDNCKTDLNENSVKPALHFADLAAKPHAANFAFAIHRLEKTSIQFEKDLHHTKHDLEHKLHKLKKKFYDYMDVTDDRLDEAERCQDLYYHEIKEDLAGIKRSLEQTSRTDTATLMEQVKKEIDESMMKWYCKIQDKTRCDSPGSHVSNTSSKSSSSDKKVSKKHKEGSGQNEADAADGACCDTHGSDDGKSGDSSSGRKKANHLRFPPQGNSDDTQSPVRPAHPGDGDSMTLQRLYEVKLKDVEQYWKAKSEEENDLLTRRIKELEELLYKETGFHNTLV